LRGYLIWSKQSRALFERALLTCFHSIWLSAAKGTHVYASLLITPLHQKGWARVPPTAPSDEVAADVAAPSLSVESKQHRRSQRTAKGNSDKKASSAAAAASAAAAGLCVCVCVCVHMIIIHIQSVNFP